LGLGINPSSRATLFIGPPFVSYNFGELDAVVEGSEAGRRFRGAVGLGVACLVFAGCATPRPLPSPAPPPLASMPAAPAPAYSQFGVASWYGPGFNGHATSSGEIYN